jgi:hypothetical protein
VFGEVAADVAVDRSPGGRSARTVNSAMKASAFCAKALAGVRITPQQSATSIVTTVETFLENNRELFISHST